MIIVSQDKTKAINFKRLNYIQVSKVDENKSIIEINHSDCNYLIIAEYKTEARAKEVAKEIRTAYSNFNYFKNATKEGKDYVINLLKHKYEQFDIYEMPKE